MFIILSTMISSHLFLQTPIKKSQKYRKRDNFFLSSRQGVLRKKHVNSRSNLKLVLPNLCVCVYMYVYIVPRSTQELIIFLHIRIVALVTCFNSRVTFGSTKNKEPLCSTKSLNSYGITKSMCGINIAKGWSYVHPQIFCFLGELSRHQVWWNLPSQQLAL